MKCTVPVKTSTYTPLISSVECQHTSMQLVRKKMDRNAKLRATFQYHLAVFDLPKGFSCTFKTQKLSTCI